ncbi:MAG: CehA/McbA family metallohydrolase [Bacteroidota bacterium]
MKKAEPEIIADAPFRVEPGNTIPVLLLAKDAEKYPGKLLRATALIRAAGQEHRVKLIPKPIVLNTKWWWKIIQVDATGLRGWVDVDVEFEFSGAKGVRTYRNDNHRTSSRKPLRVFVADQPLPKLKNTHFGDLHSHSQYTEDQVEFGAPLEASLLLSRTLGLSFFAATDHSYDLDDRMDDYLCNDPALPKWTTFQREVDVLNKRFKGFSILRGEEVSCRNHSGQNVHLLLLGGKEFIPGSGDSAERWLQTRSEHSVTDVLARKDSGAAAFAAHPAEDVPFLQRVLLHRGNWAGRDVHAGRLIGVQFANGSQTGFQRGIAQWVSALLKGNRLFAIAGNDAHGNFNRFRQLKIPFVAIDESNEHRFGEMRTAAILGSVVTERSVLDAIKSGRCVITNGPIATLAARNEAGKAGGVGTSVWGSEFGITIEARSTPEFGALEKIWLWWGTIGSRSEECILKEGTGDYSFSKQLSINMKDAGYIRLEVRTSASNDFDQAPHFCLTNPIWINHSAIRQ